MKKINLDIIKQFKDAFKFEKESDQESLDLHLNEESKSEFPDIIWLYECSVHNLGLIGIDNDINETYAIDSDGMVTYVCKGLENIPYEILRLESCYSDDETIQEVFDYDKDFELDFYKYEQWCKDNNIVLDQDKQYHDSNGNLFTKYFEKK